MAHCPDPPRELSLFLSHLHSITEKKGCEGESRTRLDMMHQW